MCGLKLPEYIQFDSNKIVEDLLVPGGKWGVKTRKDALGHAATNSPTVLDQALASYQAFCCHEGCKNEGGGPCLPGALLFGQIGMGYH